MFKIFKKIGIEDENLSHQFIPVNSTLTILNDGSLSIDKRHTSALLTENVKYINGKNVKPASEEFFFTIPVYSLDKKERPKDWFPYVRY